MFFDVFKSLEKTHQLLETQDTISLNQALGMEAFGVPCDRSSHDLLLVGAGRKLCTFGAKYDHPEGRQLFLQ